MPTLSQPPPSPLCERKPDGGLRLNFHHGQLRAWDSSSRFVVVLAGTQGGKTEFGPYWLHREIQQKGPGDYLCVAPAYPLLEKKMLPAFLLLFEERLRWGTYNKQSRIFTSRDGLTKVFFGHANDPESLEAATAKAAWLDEAGQKRFRLPSWEAIQRRLSIHQGRALITTTPYDLGWLKQKLFDPWERANRQHPEIDVVRFESVRNPAFPQAEYERAQRELPRWKFDLFYRAIFTRPAGLIYDSFDPERHVVPRFVIPENWPRTIGLDFGGVHTAATFWAHELGARYQETGRLFLYRTYLAGSRSAREHVAELLRGEPRLPDAAGGAGSEDQWRREFALAGLPVREPPIGDVEVGIDRVYAAHTRGELLIFADLADYLDEKQSYSRELDDFGEPTEKIDAKETYHLLDSERYAISWLRRPEAQPFDAANDLARGLVEQAPPGVFEIGSGSRGETWTS